jgi:hypothetical protein
MDIGRSHYDGGGYRASSDGGISSINVGSVASYGSDSYSGGAGGINY